MYREQLSYFIEAYQQKSFSRAAKLLHLTPQGLTKAVRALENELEVPLLLSHNNGTLLPTVYADKLYEYALKAEKEFTDLKKNFKLLKAKEKEILRIGFSLGLLDTIGVSFLNQFESISEEKIIVYGEDPDYICEERLAQGQYDLAFTFAPFNSSFKTESLDSIRLLKWVNKQNPLSASEIIELKDLQNHALATPGIGFKSFYTLMQACKKRNISPKFLYPTHDRKWIYRFVMQNLGIGTNIGFRLEVAHLSEEKEVVTLPFENITLDYGISWRKNAELSKLQQLFIKQVIELFKS